MAIIHLPRDGKTRSNGLVESRHGAFTRPGVSSSQVARPAYHPSTCISTTGVMHYAILVWSPKFPTPQVKLYVCRAPPSSGSSLCQTRYLSGWRDCQTPNPKAYSNSADPHGTRNTLAASWESPRPCLWVTGALIRTAHLVLRTAPSVFHWVSLFP